MNFEELIQQKKIKFQEPVPIELKCLLCNNVLINPYTVPCGHDYCLTCLTDHINNNSNPICIGSDDECKEEVLDLTKNVLKSFKSIRKIKQLKVHCLITNCTETMEIKNLKEHLEICNFQNICCPYVVVGCNIKEMNREQLKHHLIEKNIDHSNIMTKYVEEINNKNEQLKNEIDRLKENMEQQLKNEVETMKVDLSNKNVMIRNLEDELKEVKEQLQRCKNEMELNKNAIKKNTNVIKNSMTEFKNDFNNEFIKEKTNLNNELKKENEKFRKEIRNLKEESKVNETKLEKEIVQLQKSINNLKLFTLKTSFEWIVEDFVTIYEAATSNEDFYIESEPQYLCGYNIVLLLYPRRKWNASDLIYVRFKFVSGIYDGEIYWPCTRDISLCLVKWDKGGLWRTMNVINKGGEFYQKPIGNDINLSDFYWLCQCTDTLDQTNNLINGNRIKIKAGMK